MKKLVLLIAAVFAVGALGMGCGKKEEAKKDEAKKEDKKDDKKKDEAKKEEPLTDSTSGLQSWGILLLNERGDAPNGVSPFLY